MYRFHDQYKYIKKNYVKKTNNLKKISVTFGIPKLRNNNILDIKKKLGGGALFDVGVYPISIINFLFKRKLTLINSKYFFSKKKHVDLYGNAKIKVDKEIFCNLEWYIGGKYQNRIKIFFKDKSYLINFVF